LGARSPKAPTDPGVPHSGTWLVTLWARCPSHDPSASRLHAGRSNALGVVPASSPQRGGPFAPRGPGGPVPPLLRYYEALRLPAVHLAALRCLRLAIPSFVPCSSPPARDIAVDLPGVGKPELQPAVTTETAGPPRFPSHPRVPAPCSLTPVGPNTPGHCGVSTWPPPMSTTEAPAMSISRLDSTALGLAVYASQ
jgi:hypothetical protein